MIEIWKPVKNFEGLYEISNVGNIKSLLFNREKILKPAINSSGYYSIVLYKNKIKSSHTIHRLVADAFIENKYNCPLINHKNEIKTDNNVSNLEWCDVKYNNNFGTRNSKISNSLSNKIIQLDKNGNVVNIFKNSVSAKEFGFDHSSIIKCCHGKRNTHKGYAWRFAYDFL